MNPQSTLIGQARASMNAGAPTLDQVSNTAPTAVPGMGAPPATAMPQGSPMSAIHKALGRRGINPASIPQLNQPQTPQTPPQVAPQVAQQATASSAPTASMPVSETELILRALSKHLDHKGKIEEKLLNAMIPEPNGIQE